MTEWCCPQGRRLHSSALIDEGELARLARKTARRETPENVEACMKQRLQRDRSRLDLRQHTCEDTP